MTERVHFFVLGLVRSVDSPSRMEIARRLLVIFRSDKHNIRESASNLINECLCLMSNHEVAKADEVDFVFKKSLVSPDHLYHLPYSNVFIRSLVKMVSVDTLREMKDFTEDNLAKLCNNQRSS